MKSYQILREAIDRVGVKAVAARLNVSAALVYKWCQEAPSDDPTASGARNPLDRLRVIFEQTGDERIVNWLCNAAGGFYVRNPHVEPAKAEERFINSTQRVVEDFGSLLTALSRSIQNDGQITLDEAEHIRREWERLKSQAECFVVACEKGMFIHK